MAGTQGIDRVQIAGSQLVNVMGGQFEFVMASDKESRVASVLPSESVKVIAESVGVSGLADEASSFLAEDISYRLKLIIQEAEKLRQHSKRKKLTCSDFDSALQMKNIEPVYGVSNREGYVPFRHASGGGREIYFTEEKEVDLHSVMGDSTPKIPVDVSLRAHWLCIDGIQPSLPENPPPATKELQKQEILDTSLKQTAGPNRLGQKRSHPDSSGKHKHSHHQKHKDLVKLKNLATHELSVEQQYYYKEITESCVGPDEQKRAEALQSLQQDPGLHQMLPRFVAFAAEGVKINVVQNNLALLIYLMRMVKSLLDNQTVYLDKYLHDLLPAVTTCVVSRQLCLRPDMDNHWALRDFAARLVAQICRNYSNNTNNVQARITKKFSKAIQSEKVALSTQYGALAGLGELGTEVVKSSLLPYICMLGDRMKYVNEGSALNSIDKIAAEHIKKQLIKYLPPVLKSFHNSSESVEEFNVAYGYLGPFLYSMFLQKEKGLTSAGAMQTLATPARSTLQLSQRPAQIVIQQPAPSTPGTPHQSSFLTGTPSFQRTSSISSMSNPSTPTGVSGAQKFVIVSQGRSSSSISSTPAASNSLMKMVGPSQSQGVAPGVGPGAGQKIVLIQGAATVKSDDSAATPGNQVRTSILTSSQSAVGSTATSSSNISGKETL
ncbi:transcription initiation factor TFIID subunit 6 [Elysia marginata]|uniref:Histone H4 n=1 Tax=Elysia marginata TaxID=1093978 RepID=A0AAV4EPN7_9GAST|nr:transcription initiation factor TFIID subunit 6 [Elysia marginata]